MRPDCVVLVTGTGTGVGKTWVAAALAAGWRHDGATVATRKPVLSFDPDDFITDADVLAASTGEDPLDVCAEHRRYPVAMAPPIAAATLARPSFTVAELAAELRWPLGPVAYGLVEGVGGPRSPLAADGDTILLIDLIQPDHVVLVSGAGLGAINAVLLSAAALAAWRPAVFLNRFEEDDPVHVTNAEWLRRHSGLSVSTSVAELSASL